MSKRKPKSANKKKKQGQPAPTSIQAAAESRTAVAANVAWMLSLMSTITAEAIGLLCRWYTTLVEPVDLLRVLSGVMLFVALIAGLITLALIPIVLRVGQTRPPSSIVQVAVFAGSLPMLVIGLQYWLDR